MDTKLDLLYLEQKTTQSLHDRFSEVLMEQLTQRKVLFKGRQRSMVLRLRNIPRSQLQSRITSRIKSQGATPKASVWTRIGWNSPWRRGVWNFRNKYSRRVRLNPAVGPKLSSAPHAMLSPAPSTRFASAAMSRFSLTPTSGALSAVLKKRRFQGSTPRLLKGRFVRSRLGVASAAQGRDQRKAPPTKKQLDSELDRYMSKTKSRLDRQLEEYMSLSRHRLDQELDEYMAMAGEGQGEGLWG